MNEFEATRTANPPRRVLAKPFYAGDGKDSQKEETHGGKAEMALRQERMRLSDEAWVKRVLDSQETKTRLESSALNARLLEEMRLIPPEGVHRRRQEDSPPPPIFTSASEIVVPERIYAGGLVWEIGDELGKGGYGRVHMVRHLGTEQRLRLVKLIAVDNLWLDADVRRGMLWNEVGAAMAVGDYVTDEVVYDQQGNSWIAIVLERHDGKTLSDVEKEDGVANIYRHAMMLRGSISFLRQMHVRGWTHRDIKPDNLIVSETPGEETLARPIDFGVASGGGAVRRKKSNRITGSLNYLIPEAWDEEDMDLRLQDYWASMLSIGVSLGLFVLPKAARNLEDIYRALHSGNHIIAPKLFNKKIAFEYFSGLEIGKAQSDFLLWLYRFIEPHCSSVARQDVWRKRGVTQWIDLPHVDQSQVSLLPGETYLESSGGYFLDDNLFVRELEEHILALAKEAGIEVPQRILEDLQEFPERQTPKDRILAS